MLEINEVKIGNYVTNSKGDIFQITTGAFYLYHQNKEWDVLPIELTEEWMLRLPKGLEYPKWIKYLHDLQNWFYLNNEKKELHINL